MARDDVSGKRPSNRNAAGTGGRNSDRKPTGKSAPPARHPRGAGRAKASWEQEESYRSGGSRPMGKRLTGHAKPSLERDGRIDNSRPSGRRPMGKGRGWENEAVPREERSPTQQGRQSRAPRSSRPPSVRPSSSKRQEQIDVQPETRLPEYEREELNFVEGRNPVREALRANRSIDRLLVAAGDLDGSIREILAIAKERGVLVQTVERFKLDRLSRSGHHQGVVAFLPVQEYRSLEDILEIAKQKEEAPFLILLDGVTDPHNLGAVLRTAEACGAHGVILPKRNAVGLTPGVAKASAGAVEYMPVARVANLTTAIGQLKKQGIWIAGCDMGEKAYYEADLNGPLALVLGAEGEGLSRLVKQSCDFLVSVPLKGQIQSLNISVAAGIIMAHAARSR